jgi:hypothetical protein
MTLLGALARADRDGERALGRWAGIAGLCAVVVTFASLVASASGTHPATAGAVPTGQQLQDFHRLVGTQTVGLVLRVVGLLLVAGVGLFLAEMSARRGVVVSRAVSTLSVIAPVALALALAASFLALRHVSGIYIASGARTSARATHLIDHSTPLRLAAVAQIGTRILFGVWVLMLSRVALRAELLTTFLGYFGIGAGVATMVPGLVVGDALFAGWISSVALLALGWWPGGRPEAWERSPRRAKRSRDAYSERPIPARRM